MNSKHISISLVFALSATLCISTSSFAGASVKAPAKAGRTITDPLNTLRNGKGAPSSSLGINGDFYIDLSTFNIYGPKANNKWSTPTSLRGPKGLPGVAGAKSTSSSVGVKGIQGIQGVPGEKGATGEKGTIGETGLQGTAGISGGGGGSSPGAPGTSGAAGAAGSQGIQGLQGIQGMQGATGNTGSAGSSGTIAVEVVALAPWAISSSTPGTKSTSLPFGSLAPNKSYQFIFIVSGRLAIGQPSSYDPRFGLTVVSSNSLIIPTYSVTSSFGYFLDEVSSYSRVSFTVVGTVTTSALDPNTTLNFVAKDGTGSSGTDAVTFSGSGLIQLVGSLM